MTQWPEGYGRIIRTEVGSTLDAAQTLASDTPTPFWLLAHQQTKARGRRGRTWLMPEGNFAATVALTLKEPPARIALRSFVMSLALQRGFEEVSGYMDAFAMKWPNDVLMNGGKVAGILLESPGPAGLLLIGVGVNLAAAPDGSEVEAGAVPPVALKSELGVEVRPETFLNVLASHFAGLERQFEKDGFAPIRAAWLAKAARLGESVTARIGKETVSGIFEDVDPEGHLVLRGPRGAQSIAAADVYF